MNYSDSSDSSDSDVCLTDPVHFQPERDLDTWNAGVEQINSYHDAGETAVTQSNNSWLKRKRPESYSAGSHSREESDASSDNEELADGEFLVQAIIAEHSLQVSFTVSFMWESLDTNKVDIRMGAHNILSAGKAMIPRMIPGCMNRISGISLYCIYD